MRIDILSLFPGYFNGPFNESIIARAIKNGKVEINLIDIRDFSEDKHARVDDRPYGGGPGMVMMAPPISRSIESVKSETSRVIYVSPQGRRLTADTARRLASYEHMIILCGHYEGIDQRIIDTMVSEEISIGDYVLTNGCLAAIVIIDALLRFVPGVLGDTESAEADSYTNGILDCPHYTRPENFNGLNVPSVLLSGDHNKIASWRLAQALAKTRDVRPDLLVNYLTNQKLAEHQEEQAGKSFLSEAKCSYKLWVKDLNFAIKNYRAALGIKFQRQDHNSSIASIWIGNQEIQIVELPKQQSGVYVENSLIEVKLTKADQVVKLLTITKKIGPTI